MFDIKWIRDNPKLFDEGLRKRRLEPASEEILDIDVRLRSCKSSLQELQTQRNAASKKIGIHKSQGHDVSPLIDEVGALKAIIKRGEDEERTLTNSLIEYLSRLPNHAAMDVPIGGDESANIELRRHGNPRSFDFGAREHFDIGESLGLMDFNSASRISGSRFVILKGALARMERALGNFMLELQTKTYSYQEVSPPILVRDSAVFGTGQLPKFEDDLFTTSKGEAQSDRLWLIPTAEVPLTNLVREQILIDEDLPIRMCALTPCFRSEAGAAGKDARGMIRQHQFNKLELVSIVRPQESEEEHERMTNAAEEVLKRLDLAYRVVNLSTGDLGFAARKTYDLEVWLPGQGRYREISSCSNCGDFQARRMNARFRTPGGDNIEFVHTLNGSGLAVGRALIAVLENYQQADGSVVVPPALQPYMGGLKVIKADDQA